MIYVIKKEAQSQRGMVYSRGQGYSTVSWRLTEPGMNTDFWVLEPSRLSKYKMRAVNRGDETVTVNS